MFREHAWGMWKEHAWSVGEEHAQSMHMLCMCNSTVHMTTAPCMQLVYRLPCVRTPTHTSGKAPQPSGCTVPKRGHKSQQ